MIAFSDPPVYRANISYESIEEQPFQITLMLEANPVPMTGEFTWLFNNAPLISGDGVTLTVNSIRFDSLSRSHAGTYSITSVNAAGNGSATFQQIVFCKLMLHLIKTK